MANTFLQAHFHVVFGVRHRAAMIGVGWKDRLHQYLIGIFHHHGHRVLALNTMPDHLHVLFGYNVNELIPSLIQQVKRDSTLWINEKRLAAGRFAWQEGYGGFAVCKDHISPVISYIQNQELHHRKQSFLDEYRSFLESEGISYDPRYIFREPE
ncbi:MAG: transposase [Chitinophagaceae bacterium]|nr:MAG: transposase [Chitinophagaceae bacterium]